MTPGLDECLQEMGLGPRWRLRPSAGLSRNAAATPAMSTLADVHVHDENPTEVGVSAQVASPPLSVTLPHPVDPRARQAAWQQLEHEIGQCRRCALCAERRQAVPGVGDRDADWLIVGEGPGAEEDARGEPFVGPAGQLLDAMLASLGLERGKGVYIANAVKCRPPQNRTPSAEEMQHCQTYLQQQIALIQPRLILALGRAAAYSLLGREQTLSSLRGNAHTYLQGETSIPVIVSYHPAYLLRNLPDKAKAWEDLCLARSTLHQLAR